MLSVNLIVLLNVLKPLTSSEFSDSRPRQATLVPVTCSPRTFVFSSTRIRNVLRPVVR
jgi:hypothetical protein